MADLEAVLDHLKGHEALDGRFGLIGSSLGGFIALWVASRRGSMPVVTWNAPASLADLASSRSDDVTSPGAALVAEVRAGRRVEAPGGSSHVLIVQGEGDLVVPPEHGRILFERAKEPRELCLLPGADHRLSDPLHRLEAVKRSRDWLTRHLHTEPA
jgi:dipeptidyl aminopeptidase/acylaminoacyl peptidase